MQPYHIVRQGDRLLETISHPFTDDDGVEKIMVREPGNSVSVSKADTASLVPQVAMCPMHREPFASRVKGEGGFAHINCPICLRGYYYEPDKKRFYSDRPLKLVDLYSCQ